ncbi:LysR family transcriptional regulator [Faecalimonas sp.]
MELRNINTFLKVAGTQNFSKAAEQLGYSQSAVTVQIQQLEKELQIQLFERIGKRVHLTEKGQEFVSYANDIMRVTDNAKYFARQNNVLEGTLRIGGVESICTALLPDLLLKFYQICPNVQVTIKSGATDELMEMAKSNEIDFIYTLDKKIIGKEWNRAVITEEEIVFVTLEDKANGYYAGIPIQQLMQKPFILTERGAAYQYELERLLSEKDLEINPILEIGNTETIINLVKRGMGVSFLPKFTVQKELEKRVLSEIKTNLPSVKMYSQLFYHKNKWITKQMRKFIELVENFHA